MKLFNRILLIGAALIATAALTGAAQGAVFFQGQRVSAKLVGAISATPCHDSYGCVRGVVAVKWGQRPASDHLARCAHPRRLHVMDTTQGAHHTFALVRACSKTYRWMIR